MTATVLVVEDNPITRKLVEVTLGSEGMRVVSADSGRDALARIARCKPDLVLQDIALGDIHGFELLHQLRALAPARTPFVAFTGNNDERALRACGFDDVLIKPVTPDRLGQMVRSHLHGEPATQSAPPAPDAFGALGAMLGQLTRLAGLRMSGSALQSEILSTLLHACGLSVGLAYRIDGDGQLRFEAQVGLTASTRPELVSAWAAHPALIEASRAGACTTLYRHDATQPDLFERSGVTSVIVMPLAVGERRVGVLVLGSINPSISSAWRDIAGAVSGPIAHVLELARAVSGLATSEHKFRGITESTADGILVSDASGTITFSNLAADRTLGRSKQELLGLPLITALPHLASCLQSGTIVRPGGEVATIETSSRSFEDPPGQLSWVHVIRDVTDRLRIDHLTVLANHDALTGLWNRRRFNEELASRVAAAVRYDTPGAVLLIDLDYFKAINDTYGHAAGDTALRAVASILDRNTRASDAAARLGGDELALLLDHTSLAGAKLCADKLIELLSAAPLEHDGAHFSIGASIGIAAFPRDGQTPAAILAVADAALYRAKLGGRGRACTSEDKP